MNKKKRIKPYLAKRREKLMMVMKAEQYNFQDIADVFGMSRHQVHRIINRYQNEGTEGGGKK